MFYVGYHKYRQNHSTNAVPTLSILFDVNDPSTMTRPQTVSTKWDKSTLSVVRTTRYGVVTVYDNNFGANEVLAEVKSKTLTMLPRHSGSWNVHTHCEWCGQALDYVAVIVGITNGGDAMVHHIGCDCVGKIFGVKWFGYRSADDAKKVLIEKARSRRRAIEYPTKYATELAWLDSLPEMVLNRKTFLKDMKRIMRSGEREISKKMANLLAILMKDKQYNPQTFAVATREVDVQIDKVRMIEKMVKDADGENITKCWSAYTFVSSVLGKLEQYRHPLTRAQMDAMNKVYTRYNASKVNFASINTHNLKGNPNDVPW